MEALISVVDLLAKVKQLVADRRRAVGELRDLRSFTHDLLDMRDQERKEVSCGLQHAAQSIAALKVSLSMATSSAALSPQASQAMTDATALLGICASEIETICYAQYPPLLDHFGLPAAMDWQVKWFMETSGIHTVLDVPCNLGRLSAGHELALFRIMQEGLMEVRRNSANRTARVHLYRSPTEVGLEVAGAGRATQRQTPPVAASAIRERARHLGGRLEIVSVPGSTTLRVTLPIPSRQAEARLA